MSLWKGVNLCRGVARARPLGILTANAVNDCWTVPFFRRTVDLNVANLSSAPNNFGKQLRTFATKTVAKRGASSRAIGLAKRRTTSVFRGKRKLRQGKKKRPLRVSSKTAASKTKTAAAKQKSKKKQVVVRFSPGPRAVALIKKKRRISAQVVAAKRKEAAALAKGELNEPLPTPEARVAWYEKTRNEKALTKLERQRLKMEKKEEPKFDVYRAKRVAKRMVKEGKLNVENWTVEQYKEWYAQMLKERKQKSQFRQVVADAKKAAELRHGKGTLGFDPSTTSDSDLAKWYQELKAKRDLAKAANLATRMLNSGSRDAVPFNPDTASPRLLLLWYEMVKSKKRATEVKQKAETKTSEATM